MRENTFIWNKKIYIDEKDEKSLARRLRWGENTLRGVVPAPYPWHKGEQLLPDQWPVTR